MMMVVAVQERHTTALLDAKDCGAGGGYSAVPSLTLAGEAGWWRMVMTSG
jgi:hypothetical protein